MSGVAGSLAKAAAAALFLLLAPAAPVFAQQAAPQTAPEVVFSKGEVTIRTASGKYHPFTVELALNNAQRSQGLMFRTQMPVDHGMLFDFGATRQVAMWMENTVLPLDMLFIQPNGTISHIRENAVPYSRDVIDSRGPVTYVLELNAGRVRALGIRVGDKVIGKAIRDGR